MSIHSKGGRHEVRWREGTRNRGRTFDRKSDAQDFEAHVRRELQRGQAIPTRVGQTTLAEYFRDWLKDRHDLAPRTIALYEECFQTHVFDQIGYVPLSNLSSQRLRDWHSERLEAGAGPKVLAKTVTLLGAVLKDAVQQDQIIKNPVLAIKKPKQRYEGVEPATPKQVEAIRARFIANKHHADAVLVSLMAYGGLRVGEALALKWEDFSKGNQLWIERSLENDGSFKTTKNELERLVVLPEAAAKDLLAWRRSGAEGLVFPRAKDGKGWTKTDRNNWRRRYFSEAAKSAGLENFPPKNLRHSCASLMIAAGRPSTEVATTLGHSLGVSVRVYQRLMREMEGQPVRTVDEMIAEARTLSEQADEKQRLKEAIAQERERVETA